VTAIDAAAPIVAQAAAEAARAGAGNVTFEVGDVYALPFPDAAFDVVHAHQVLQHLTDPVAALRHMRRVCRPGGIVAARDGDYGGMFWYPLDPELEEWQALYRRVARALGGEPDAGRRLLSWARAAGFTGIEASASSWCYATPDDRAFWGGLWAERVTESDFARQALRHGLATSADLSRLAAAWRRWAAADDGWFVVPHGEILCRA
jgi:SAM-dependent methyltransferase